MFGVQSHQTVIYPSLLTIILIIYFPHLNCIITFSGLTKMQYVIRQFSQQIGKAIHLRQTEGGEHMRELLTEAKKKQWTNIIVDLTASQTSLLLKMVIYFTTSATFVL